MKLSVIIVNYNVKHYLNQCLHSLARALDGVEHEVFVVDNNSSDGSVEYLKTLYPNVKYIENKDNVGFAKANNQAISQSTGEYVLLINPDTFVGEETVKECIALLDSRKDVGATGVQMLNRDGSFAFESRRGFPSPFTAFCKMSGLCSLFPKSRTFGRYYMRYLDISEANEIDVISGAYTFIRRATLDKSGLLDEAFFMYGEDIDLSYRLKLTGYKNYYLPARILHYKGESTHKTSFKYVYAFYHAMIIFFKKHFSSYSFFLSLCIYVAIYMKAFCVFVTRQMRRPFSKSSDHLQYMRRFRYLLIGDETSLDRMVQLADSYGLTVGKLLAEGDVLKSGHHALEDKDLMQYDYVVYDADIYSYSSILDQMSRSLTGGKRLQVGTYCKQTDCIITYGKVFA